MISNFFQILNLQPRISKNLLNHLKSDNLINNRRISWQTVLIFQVLHITTSLHHTCCIWFHGYCPYLFWYRPCPFIHILPLFYPDFIQILFNFFPDFTQIFKNFTIFKCCPDFIQIFQKHTLSKFYPKVILISSG